jgi:hypothetical protein
MSTVGVIFNPEDFMFKLSDEEYTQYQLESINIGANTPSFNRSQIVTGSQKHRDPRYLPYAFTEQGIAMLSSVLRSPRAVAVNIAIMRTFVQLRHFMDGNRELAARIESIESRYDEQFKTIFELIKQLIAEDATRKSQPKREVGFYV